jgi:hypothetical protein
LADIFSKPAYLASRCFFDFFSVRQKNGKPENHGRFGYFRRCFITNRDILYCA